MDLWRIKTFANSVPLFLLLNALVKNISKIETHNKSKNQKSLSTSSRLFSSITILSFFESLHWKLAFHRTTSTVDLKYFEYNHKKPAENNRTSIYWLPQITVKTRARTTESQNRKQSKLVRGLTRVGVRVAVCFGPLVRRGLVVELVLWLNQRKRVWDQGSTTHRLVVA